MRGRRSLSRDDQITTNKMETKYTPGPWIMGSVQNNDGMGNYSHTIGPVIVRQHFLGKTEMEIHANAQLIAAAPELLEAAQAALKLLDEMMRGHDEGHTAEWLRAAISKATGTK